MATSLPQSRSNRRDPCGAPYLPIEVCERIIDFVPGLQHDYHGGRHRTLHACCLTCRDWLPRSRFHLYDDVHLRDSHKSHNPSRFIDCLNLNPSNGLLVRRLTVDPRVVLHHKSTRSSVSPVASELPDRLPMLDSIVFMYARLTHCAELSHFRNVHSVELWNCNCYSNNELFNFVTSFPALSSLSINMASGALREDITSNGKLVVQRLDVSVTPGLLPTIINLFTPDVTSLTVELWPCEDQTRREEQFWAAADFIQRCGDSLTQLNINWQAESLMGIELLDFSHNINLCSLKIEHIPISLNASQAEGGMRSVARLLATTSSRCLDDITVRLFCSSHKLQLPVSAWNTLDSTLTLPVFSHLKHASVGLCSGRQRQLELSSTSMAGLLPKLASSPAANFAPSKANSIIVQVNV